MIQKEKKGTHLRRAGEKFAYFELLLELTLNRIFSILYYHTLSKKTPVPQASGKELNRGEEKRAKDKVL